MPNKKEWLSDLGIFLLGGILYAVAVNLFTVPADIAPGGATGLSVLANYLFGVPVGVGIILVNLPLFILSIRQLGKVFLFKTAIATVLLSVTIDITALFIPAYQGSRLLAALYGGLLSGIGLSLVLLRGATTGGSDIAAKLLTKRFPAFGVASTIFVIDAIVILLSTLVYRDFDSGLYACLMIFTSTTLMDRLLYHAGMGKLVIIITSQGDLLAQTILHQVERGCTRLNGVGAYSGTTRQILLCVTRRNEVWRLGRLVKQIDPQAFVTVCEAGQVLGQGFSAFS